MRTHEGPNMKIAMISTYFTHHQEPLSNALYRLLDGNYTFYCTESVPDERVRLGYASDQFGEYVRRADECGYAEADLPDVLIAGVGAHKLISRCISAGKLVFRYSERPVKENDEQWKFIPRFVKWHIQNPRRARIRLLCASAFTMKDYKRFLLFHGRGYKWGYFPETKRYASLNKLMEAKDPTRVIWCGRMLDWKHPDDALEMSARLKERGLVHTLEFIGDGEMLGALKAKAAELCIEDSVVFSGTMPPESVRKRMERAGIFILTSDRREGWGAVLNEAMNSGCAVTASDAAGSVPYLIENGQNGFSYRSGDVEELTEKVAKILGSVEKQRRLGAEAYKTITEQWNAEAAAERLIKLAQAILGGDDAPGLYESGPCSRA